MCSPVWMPCRRRRGLGRLKLEATTCQRIVLNAMVLRPRRGPTGRLVVTASRQPFSPQTSTKSNQELMNMMVTAM